MRLIERRRLRYGLAIAAIAMVAVGCSSSATKSGGGSTNSSPPTASGTKISGGTVTWAESPGSEPNYIFPIYSPQVCSVANISQFQDLMYRPLFWYGNNNQASVDYDYSIANQPTFSTDGKTVTVTLKSNYKWSDGESVDARDVVFFMNLVKAEKANFCPYVQGLFPDNVVSYSATSADTVQFVFTKAYNPTWVIYNELSQITPLPLAWDTTNTGTVGPTTDTGALPDTTPTGAAAVYTALNKLATNAASYTTSPIWGVVDGPWKLTNFTNTGEADFVPNPSYGGPDPATISEFKELPYTATTPEETLAKSGSTNLTIGWADLSQLANLNAYYAAGYNGVPAYAFSSAYMVLNQHNPKFGPVFSQLYFRQAFEDLVDQEGDIKAYATEGSTSYATPQLGVIPTKPANSFLAPDATTNEYPFSISTASQLLSSHGWTVKSGGTTTCTDPGSGSNQCGAGVPAGLGLSFNLDYLTGNPVMADWMDALKSDAAQVGVDLQLTTHTFDTVISTATACQPSASNCSWTAENWGAGWVYSPDYYPTGEEIIQTGAGANFENYSNSQMDSLINASITATAATAQSTLDAYQDYVRQQLPVVFIPNTAGNPQPTGVTLVAKNLGGFSINAYDYITPEQYYFTKS